MGWIREEYNSHSGSQEKGAAMKRSQGKQIIYRYNGDPSTEQTISDRAGAMLTPSVGAIVNRNGEEWCVVSIHHDLDLKGPMAVPTHHVFRTHAA